MLQNLEERETKLKEMQVRAEADDLILYERATNTFAKGNYNNNTDDKQ